jgi:ubiquinone/menaquinone biosynthesis C-methylase UbiE
MIRKKRKDLILDGIDIDPRMIAIAQERSQGTDISFHVSSADKLPFPDQSTDIALSSMVFHHLPHTIKQEVFRETKRILKSQGEFLLSDFSKNDKVRSSFRKLIWTFHATVLSLLEPEVKPQLQGQLFELAQEHGATIDVLSFPRVLVGLHSIRFPVKT